MAGRLTVLPDERFLALRPVLRERLREAARSLAGGAFTEFFDRAMRSLLVDGFGRTGAHEGTVWLLDEAREALVPRFNSGPNAAEFVGSYRQSLRSGMISMVVAMEQPICENDVFKNEQQDKTLDQKLAVRTWAMLAVPFYYVGELRGVITAVQLVPADNGTPEPPGFRPEHLDKLQLTTALLGRLIESQLLALCLGLEEMA